MNFRVAAEGAVGLRQHERRTRHGFDAAGHRQLYFAGADGARHARERVEPRAAQSVDGGTRYRHRQPREQRRHARDVAVVLARLVGAAEHHLLDRGRIEPGVALEERRQRDGGEVVGAHRGERTAVAPDGSTHRIADEGLLHARMIAKSGVPAPGRYSARSRSGAVSARRPAPRARLPLPPARMCHARPVAVHYLHLRHVDHARTQQRDADRGRRQLRLPPHAAAHARHRLRVRGAAAGGVRGPLGAVRPLAGAAERAGRGSARPTWYISAGACCAWRAARNAPPAAR